MALFDTPNLLPHIFQKQQFPEGSGIAALATGLIGGLRAGKEAKEENYSFMGAVERGMQRGAELNQSVQNPIHPVMRAVHEQNLKKGQFELENALLRRQQEVDRTAGMSKIGKILQDSSLDPDTLERNVLGAAYEHNLPHQEISTILDGIQQKRLYRQRMDQLEQIQNMAAQGGMQLKRLGMSASGPVAEFDNPALSADNKPSADSMTAADYQQTVEDIAKAESDPAFDPVKMSGLRAKKQLLEWKATSGMESDEVRDATLRKMKTEYVLSRIGKFGDSGPEAVSAYMKEFDDINAQIEGVGGGQPKQPQDPIGDAFKKWIEGKQSK